MTRLGRIKLANLVLFQLGWFACVLGAAYGYPWVALLTAAFVIAAHLSWAARPGMEIKLLVVCGLTGILFDSLLLATGWVDFPNGWWLPGLAPYWMTAMWLLFGTSLNLSISWLHGRPRLAALFGATGGPLAYLAGERLGGITLVETLPAVIALAVGWGVVTPLLFNAAGRFDGFREPRFPDYITTGLDSPGGVRGIINNVVNNG